MKIIKYLWVGIAIFTLIFTLYAYDGLPNSDIWIFHTWMMLFLSFPSGLLISAALTVLGEYFSIWIETSIISLTVEWICYFFLGYFQWFKLVPWLIKKAKSYFFNGISHS